MLNITLRHSLRCFYQLIAGGLVLTSVSLLAGCERPSIESFRTSWAYQALMRQAELDADQSLSRSTFIYAKESYNSRAYATQLSYVDPQQELSIYDQLDIGVRALELDIHSFFYYDLVLKQWRKELVLCHAGTEHIGCGPFDRPLVDALTEIANWLERAENSNEVVVIFIDNYKEPGAKGLIAQDDVDTALAQIDDYLGNHIYKPESGGCELIPEDLTKNKIRAAGKNIIMMVEGCEDNRFNALMYGGTGAEPWGFGVSKMVDLQPYPMCDHTHFDRSEYKTTMIRAYEDRTILSALFSDPGPKITTDSIVDLLNCEINLIGINNVNTWDGRLEKMVWSWNQDEPKELETRACAIHQGNGRFAAQDCAIAAPIACRNATGGWIISTEAVDWSQGQDICASIDGEFAVPFSGYDNVELVQAKLALDVDQVWLNYDESQW